MLTSRFHYSLIILLLSCWLLPSSEASASIPDSLKAAQVDAEKLQQAYLKVQKNYRVRRGLLGAQESEEIFDRALLAFMMKDYDKASLLFFFLVDSEALDNVSLRYQAQWYLAESAYHIQNYTVSRQACLEIVEVGSSHSFFDDAVRRLLEIYGLTGDSKSFQQAYERFILTRLVKPSDKINYSIGKSLYWQGKYPSAKAALNDIGEKSSLYSRTLYILGGILAEEGDFDMALQNFARIEKIKPANEEEQEILELAMLAQGRIYYETEQYLKAILAYQKIPGTSKYYPDLLYELAWTFIKQEAWDDAARIIDVFLLAFPNHENAIRLKVVQGDIYLQSQDYEKALVSYENVLKDLRPVRESLNKLATNDAAAKLLLQSMIQGQDFTEALPDYTLTVLREEKNLSKSIDLNKSLSAQGNEVESIRQVVDSLNEVFSRQKKLGSFNRGRVRINQLREECLSILSKTIASEMSFLEGRLSGAEKRRIQRLRQQWENQDQDLKDIKAITENRKAYTKAHRDQIQALQDSAFQIQLVKDKLAEQLKKSKKKFNEKKSKMSPEDNLLAQDSIDNLERQFAQIDKGLKQILSKQLPSRLMSRIERTNGADVASFNSLYERMWRLHNQKLKPFWSQTRQREQATSQEAYVKLWTDVRKTYRKIQGTEMALNSAEQKERSLLKSRLLAEEQQVAKLEGQLKLLTKNVDQVGTNAALNGFKVASEQISKKVLQADLGVVRIYWTRKVDVDKKIRQLSADKKTKESALKSRFDYINSQLKDESKK